MANFGYALCKRNETEYLKKLNAMDMTFWRFCCPLSKSITEAEGLLLSNQLLNFDTIFGSNVCNYILE